LYCVGKTNLMCRKVPTKVRKAGNYVFELFAVPKEVNNKVAIAQKTENIRINPYQVSVKILEFAVNGQEALPKYILPINPLISVRNFVISWKVAGDKNTKVELLPSPGTVALEGSIFSPVSQQLGREIITLLVTESSGQKMSRSIAIEKVLSPLIPPLTPDVKGVVPSAISPKGTDGKNLPLTRPRILPIAPKEAGKKSSILAPASPPSSNSLPSQLNIPIPPPLIQGNPQPNNLSFPTFSPIPSPTFSPILSPTPSPTPSLLPSPMENHPQFD
jgi:hypothetical protein